MMTGLWKRDLQETKRQFQRDNSNKRQKREDKWKQKRYSVISSLCTWVCYSREWNPKANYGFLFTVVFSQMFCTGLNCPSLINSTASRYPPSHPSTKCWAYLYSQENTCFTRGLLTKGVHYCNQMLARFCLIKKLLYFVLKPSDKVWQHPTWSGPSGLFVPSSCNVCLLPLLTKPSASSSPV